MLRRLFVFLFGICTAVCAQQGALTLHFMDVGQGHGAILISPGGEVVAFDLGEDLVHLNCDKPPSYLEQLGIDHIDYRIVSHYHQDHLGCVPEVLAQYPLREQAFDRWKSCTSATYNHYVTGVGNKRATATIGQHLSLAGGVDIEMIALNGNGITTTNENDLSLTARITYGNFRAEAQKSAAT